MADPIASSTHVGDPRVRRLAELLVRYCAPVEPEQSVEIAGTTAAAALLREIYRETIHAGGIPFLQIRLPDQEEILFKTASDRVLQAVSPVTRLVVETFDRSFRVMSAENTRALSGIDPTRVAMRQRAMNQVLQRGIERMTDGSYQETDCLYPTNGYAQEAGMSLADYEDFVYRACQVDRDDPAGAWEELGQRQQVLIESFHGKRDVHITGPDTDLRLSIEGRRFLNDAGKENMPGGEIYTSPVEDSAEGQIRFSFPAVYRGQVVEDVVLSFERGTVVDFSARTNGAFLGQMLELDDGARRLGELAFGTNPGIQRFTHNLLFDEKIGGTMHLALGMAIPEAGGVNRSTLHWDMVTDLRVSSEIRVDGRRVAKNGLFPI